MSSGVGSVDVDEASMLDVRGSGPSNGQPAAIVDADVKRYAISSVGDA